MFPAWHVTVCFSLVQVRGTSKQNTATRLVHLDCSIQKKKQLNSSILVSIKMIPLKLVAALALGAELKSKSDM